MEILFDSYHAFMTVFGCWQFTLKSLLLTIYSLLAIYSIRLLRFCTRVLVISFLISLKFKEIIMVNFDVFYNSSKTVLVWFLVQKPAIFESRRLIRP